MQLSDISDDHFLQLLEDRDMPASFFSHAGHIRAAWLYLDRYPISEAIDKCCLSIKGYAESTGAHDKFHLTLTIAMVSLVACYRLPGGKFSSWLELASSNEPIMSDAQGFILHYYSPGRLSNPRAKKHFYAPDKRPFGLA